jgi:hypothetical protein
MIYLNNYMRRPVTFELKENQLAKLTDWGVGNPNHHMSIMGVFQGLDQDHYCVLIDLTDQEELWVTLSLCQ